MCDEKLPNLGILPYTELNRRQFWATAAATAAAAGMAGSAQAQVAVTEKNVVIRTKDGACDSTIYYPTSGGPKPGVLLWTDIGGVRPANRDMAKRMAGQGYVVLLPNPFYRGGVAAVMSALNNQVPADAAKKAASRPDNAGIERDAKTLIAYLDALPQTSNAKIGVQGYCMGGNLSVRTAAAVPNRIGVVGSFHGGNGLVLKTPESPHLLIEKTNARYLFATAQNDDMNDPTVKGVLRETLYKTGKPGLVDVYKANHGWCVPGGAVYNEAEAERAWATLTAMYKQTLV